MNTDNRTLHDKLWQGEPWPDEFTSLLARPSAGTRDAVYAAARAAAAVPARRASACSFLSGRSRLAYAAMGVCACTAIAVCIWLGSPGRGSSSMPKDPDVIAIAGEVEQYADADIDADDQVFTDSIESVEIVLACLADDLAASCEP